MFGSSMAAHHLLYVYLSVWIIQGGYAAWIFWQWKHSKRSLEPVEPISNHHENS
jgi:hypothetical protein